MAYHRDSPTSVNSLPKELSHEVDGQEKLGVRRFVQVSDPTPDEVAEFCQQIQSGWSEDVRRSRAGVFGLAGASG